MTFEKLGLNARIVQTLGTKGYLHPTPIQAKSIPHILNGSDVFGSAQTGTGKTAAFALPVIQRMIEENTQSTSALVLVPTRELAIQVAKCMDEYAKGTQIRYALIYGGVSPKPQIDALRRGVQIIIATPGRLLDLYSQRHVRLDGIKFLVLDEADRMLDMGFIHDIKKILKIVPAARQTLFFSATISPEIKVLADGILKRGAIKISVDAVSSPAEKIVQSVYFVQKEMKRNLLKHVIIENSIKHALVFTRTKHRADRVAKDLVKAGIKAAALHGDKSQNARERALSGFHNKTIEVLVATDVASRGLDISKLSHVINYEIPEIAETYIHRIGRTGRAGEEGIAISFCTVEEKKYWENIKKLSPARVSVVNDHPYNVN